MIIQYATKYRLGSIHCAIRYELRLPLYFQRKETNRYKTFGKMFWQLGNLNFFPIYIKREKEIYRGLQVESLKTNTHETFLAFKSRGSRNLL